MTRIALLGTGIMGGHMARRLAAAGGDELFAASMAPGAEDRFRYLFESPQDRAGFGAWLGLMTAERISRYWFW